MSQLPKRRPPAGQGQNRSQSQRRSDPYAEYPPPSRRSAGPPPPGGRYYQQRPRAVYPQRDPFPYILGGLIGAMLVGLMLVIFLLINNNNGTTAVQNRATTGNTTTTDQTTGETTDDTPPRMSMDDFKALYDDPAKRPMIIDVRPSDAYNEGHIAGAVSMPEDDIDILLDKIPKDSLVIAYCQ